jgi:hypothetical protein
LGQPGKHWGYTEERGVHAIPPYNVFNYSAPELLNTAPKINGSEDFFLTFAARPEWLVRSQSPEERAFDAAYRRTEWGLRSPIGPPDVLPSAGLLYEDLRNLQERVFTEIIRGDVGLVAFDAFVDEWYRRGGSKLTEEAQQMLALKRQIEQRFATLRSR